MPHVGTKQRELTQKFSINVCFYYRQKEMPWRSQRITVYDLVYGGKLQDLEQEYIEFLHKGKEMTDGDIEPKQVWRWIHLPANNVNLTFPESVLKLQR